MYSIAQADWVFQKIAFTKNIIAYKKMLTSTSNNTRVGMQQKQPTFRTLVMYRCSDCKSSMRETEKSDFFSSFLPHIFRPMNIFKPYNVALVLSSIKKNLAHRKATPQTNIIAGELSI